MGEQSITQLFRQLDPLFVQKYGAQWKRVTTPATVTPSVGAGAASTALTQHAGLDWIEAHPTKDPAVNRTRTYYSINFGIIGGAGVDESNNILAMLNAVGLAGGGTVVICAVDPADPIHIAKTISIYYSNVHVVFPPGQVITYEDKGSLRIMGDYAQITRKLDGTAMKLHVDSTVVSNETVLELSATDTALMDAEANPALRIVRVGDKIVVRGQNDASGKSIEKDTSFVKALAKVGSYWQITCTDELDYTFKPTYPASEWPADLTTGTTIYVIEGSLITVNTDVNDTVVTVTDGTVFSVGDMVEVGDNRNEYAMNASAITGAGNPYKNPANLEQAQIIAISGNDITLDHALCRAASTTYYAFMALMVPVVNSTISGARISYTADGIRSANALQITYAMDCHIHDCYVYGLGGRKGHGLRISYSYKCTAYRNHIVGALYTGSGEGYGITIYYATLIMVDNNYISGCRHNILLQLATLAKVISNTSIDDRISGIDLHGVYSVFCTIQNNSVTRSRQNTTDSDKSGGIRIGNTSHTGGDHYNTIQGNKISNYFGYNDVNGSGIDIFAASTGNKILNNIVQDCWTGLRFGLNSKQITPVQTIDNTLIQGNVFARCENRTVEIIAQPVYDNVASNGKFSNITMIDNVSDGNNRQFEITGVVTNLGITNVIMNGNKIINPLNTTTTYYGVSVKYVAGFVHIYDNDVSTAQRGIYLQGNGVCHVVGNKTANTVQSDPYTDGGGNTSVNYVDAMSGGGTGVFASTVAVSNATPAFSLYETDAAANNRRWDILANAETFYLRAVDDAYSAAQAFMGVTRTNNVIDLVALEGTAISLTGATTITGSLTVTGGFSGGSSAFTVNPVVTNTAPAYVFVETGATANNTRWDIAVDGMVMYYRLVNDANNSATSWMYVGRSANTVTSVDLAAAAIGLTGAVNVTGALGASGFITQTSANPAYIWIESDAASNNKRWDIIANAEQWRFRVVNDAGSSATNAITIDRTANTVDSIALAATAINVNGALESTGLVTQTNANPAYIWVESDASSNNKRWDIIANSEQLMVRVVDDAASSATNAIIIDRTANTVDSIELAATSVKISGKVTDGNGGYRQHFSFTGLSTGVTVDILANNGDRAEGVAVFGMLKHSAVTGACNRLTAAFYSGVPYNETMNGTDTFRMTCTSGGKVSMTHYAGSSGTFSGSFDVYWSA